MSTPNNRQAPSHEAGWYADPVGVWTWRWFDGSDWTGTVNDGQTNHSDLASLMAHREVTANAAAVPAAAPPPPRPVASAPAQMSSGRLVKRIIAWSAGGVVAIFALLVVIGLVFGADSDPIASVEGADVFASLEATGDGADETWFVVVESGTSITELEGIVESLLDLPEADGLRLSGHVLDSTDELEGYVELSRALVGELDVDQLSATAGEVDIDVITENTVGFLAWSDSADAHVLCTADVLICTADSAVATFPR